MQEEAQRAAQDLEDEEIQRRLQATREAAAADAARSVSPPVHNRPMSPPPGSAPRSPLPPPGVEPPEFRVRSLHSWLVSWVPTTVDAGRQVGSVASREPHGLGALGLWP